METKEVRTLEELKNARKNNADEIIVTGDLIGKIKKASRLKYLFYWLIIILLALGLNIGISSQILDIYSVIHLRTLGITRTISIIAIVLLILVIIIFGLMNSRIFRYKISFLDKVYKGAEKISLIKVWYF